MKKCELCNSRARVLCESDGAALCWDCDSTVHSSNFLFAKHLRSLLCNTCHSPTPWTGSGSILDRTFSLCDSCILSPAPAEQPPPHDHHQNTEDEDTAQDSDDDDDDDDDGDNQVVPIQPPSFPSNTEDPRRKFRFR